MRILAVLYCFPPILVPAAVRYLKLVLGLRELGVKVEILVIDPDSFAAPAVGLDDTSMLSLVPNDLVRHVVWSPEVHPGVTLLKRFPRIRSSLYRFFEPRKREWTFAARHYLRRLDLGEYDLVLTCSQPHANHLLGLHIKETAGIPWIAYFGDPWYRNPYAHYDSARIARYHRELESRVLEAADHLFFTSEEMRRFTESEYPGAVLAKSGVLPNSFIPDWYTARTVTEERRARTQFLHTGHFYGPRTPRPLLRALAKVGETETLRGTLRFTCYGSMSPADRTEIDRLGLAGVFETRDVVPYLESLALMSRFDYLLLVDAELSTTEESVFLPSKLVDYLGSGTPIVALTPSHGTSARLVAEAGGIVCDIASPESIENLIRNFTGDPVPSATPVPEAVHRFHYLQVAGHLVSTMEQVIARRNRRPRDDRRRVFGSDPPGGIS